MREKTTASHGSSSHGRSRKTAASGLTWPSRAFDQVCMSRDSFSSLGRGMLSIRVKSRLIDGSIAAIIVILRSPVYRGTVIGRF
ncbi:MAG TPA: hypothetical protein VE079_09775 [Ensifer sp.]|nr:hypothetical protein [Ensifer sp.]